MVLRYYDIIFEWLLCIQGSDSGRSSPTYVERKRYHGGRQRKQKSPKSEDTNSGSATPSTAESPCVEDAPLPIATSSPAAASPDHTPTSTRNKKTKNTEV